MEEVKSEEKKIITKIANLQDNLASVKEELGIEEGNLMLQIRADKPFRVVAFCRFNASGNEVTGTASRGVEWFIAAEGHSLHFLDIHGGRLDYVCLGNDNRNLEGVVTGHAGLITALAHDGLLVFSGGTDEWIISWDGTSKTKNMLNLFRGHEGSITALVTNDK